MAVVRDPKHLSITYAFEAAAQTVETPKKAPPKKGTARSLPLCALAVARFSTYHHPHSFPAFEKPRSLCLHWKPNPPHASRMMRRSTLFLLLANSVSVVWGFGNNCCLCNGCSSTVTSQDYEMNVAPFGQVSCPELDFQLLMGGQVAGGSSTCTNIQNTWRTCCCTSNTAGCNFIDVSPADPPPVVFPAGSYPWCDICDGGVYPGNPGTITMVAYIPGNPTCADLYWMGRTYNIPDAMCQPLRSFMRIPCGCLTPGTPPGGNPPPADPNPPVVFMGPKPVDTTSRNNLRIGVLELTRGGAYS